MARICIYGVGAIGGFLAARLAAAGARVSGIARGEQLAAIRERGLRLVQDGAEIETAIECVDQPANLGIQDYVFLTMKSHVAPAIADAIAPLLGPDTAVVTAYNGFPWWYFHESGVDDGTSLNSVDPGGRLWQQIGPGRAIGCVVYPAARIAGPGIIEHVFGDRFTIGEADGTHSNRLLELAAVMKQAGFEVSASPNIRVEIWLKLVANAAFNPVSLLTGRTVAEMLDDPAVYNQLIDIMTEAAAVATAHGIQLPVQPAELLELTRPFGAHKTSMLQDFEAGREVELDTIVASIAELAKRRHVSTPALDSVLDGARNRVAQQV